MAAPTNTDCVAAGVYATNILENKLATRFKLTAGFQQFSFVDQYIAWPEEDALRIFDETKLEKKYAPKFSEAECNSVSCVGTQYNATPCLPGQGEQRWRTDDPEPQFFVSCTPSCFEINKAWSLADPKPTMVELVWRNGKCTVVNSALAQFAKWPQLRGENHVDGVTNVPPNKWNAEAGTMEISKEYCTWFGTEYDSTIKDCYTPKWEQILARFLFGNTLTRLMAHSADLTGRKQTYQILLDKLKGSVGRMLAVETIRTTITAQPPLDFVPPLATPLTEESFWDKWLNGDYGFFINIITDIGFDVIITDNIISLIRRQLTYMLSQVSSEAMLAILKGVGGLRMIDSLLTSVLIKRTVLDTSLKAVGFFAKQLLKLSLMLTNVVDYALIVIAIASLILDLIDPFSLNKQLYKEQFDYYARYFTQVFGATYGSASPEFTPLHMVSLSVMAVEGDEETSDDPEPLDDEMFALMLNSMAAYLRQLPTNSWGQNIDWDNDIPSTDLGPPDMNVFTKNKYLYTPAWEETFNQRNDRFVQSHLKLKLAFLGLQFATAGSIVLLKIIGGAWTMILTMTMLVLYFVAGLLVATDKGSVYNTFSVDISKIDYEMVDLVSTSLDSAIPNGLKYQSTDIHGVLKALKWMAERRNV